MSFCALTNVRNFHIISDPLKRKGNVVVDEKSFNRYLSGDVLYGDDFTVEEIENWFRDEEQAYFNLIQDSSQSSDMRSYGYHCLNRKHGFRHLPDGHFARVLSLGGAYGDEIVPVIDRIGDLTIVEPASGFSSDHIQGIPVKFVEPDVKGTLPYPEDTFSLELSFGTLHHIPNVSAAISEMARCLAPGGYLLVREPIVSMGDWRKSRRGLTSRERGIPLKVFDQIIMSAGLSVVKKTLCMFAPMNRLNAKMKDVYDSEFLVNVDKILSTLFSWNYRYHRSTWFEKISPTAVFYVLKK